MNYEATYLEVFIEGRLENQGNLCIKALALASLRTDVEPINLEYSEPKVARSLDLSHLRLDESLEQAHRHSRCWSEINWFENADRSKQAQLHSQRLKFNSLRKTLQSSWESCSRRSYSASKPAWVKYLDNRIILKASWFGGNVVEGTVEYES